MPRWRLTAQVKEDINNRLLLYKASLARPIVGQGTEYPCKQEQLEHCWNFQAGTPLPSIDAFSAVTNIDSWNHALRPLSAFATDELEAMRKIQDAVDRTKTSPLHPSECGPDVLLKIFSDLDTVVFLKTLCGKVTVSWTNVKRDDTLGWISPSLSNGAQCHIFLNARLLLTSFRFENLLLNSLGVLLHELCVSEGLIPE